MAVFIPGLGFGGTMSSGAPAQSPPTMVINGTIVSVPPTGILNSSGIQLSYNKILSMPAGWKDMDNYDEMFSDGAQEIRRTFIGPWHSRGEFIQWAIGYSSNVPSGSGGQLRRSIPVQHPVWPWLYCTRADPVEGVGAIIQDPNMVVRSPDGVVLTNPDGSPIYIPMICYVDGNSFSEGMAKVKLTYGDLAHDVLLDEVVDSNHLSERCRFVERVENYTLQALPLNTQRLKFAEGDFITQQVGQGTITVFSQSVVFKWHRVPDVPETAIRNCGNHINATVFDPPYTVTSSDGLAAQTISPSGDGYPAGTLLLATVEKVRTPRNVTGRVSWLVQYGFHYRPEGHNKFPDSQGRFWLATSDGTPTGRKLHQDADFDTLYQLPAPRNYQYDG